MVGCVAAVAGESSVGVRTALITALAPGGERIAALAKYRVVSQVGMAAGAGAGALVIQVDSRPVYTAMLVGTALAYLLAALLVGRLPRAEGGRGRRGRRGSGRVLRDHRYLTLAGLFGVLTVNWSMLSVGIPLWVAEHTDAPRWTSGGDPRGQHRRDRAAPGQVLPVGGDSARSGARQRQIRAPLRPGLRGLRDDGGDVGRSDHGAAVRRGRDPHHRRAALRRGLVGGLGGAHARGRPG
ncbi:hypothetical protein GCM10020001_024300 [Nonomuraea salmonea]